MALDDTNQIEDIWQGIDILRVLGWGVKSKMRQLVQQYRATGNVWCINQAITLPQNRRNKILTFAEKEGVAYIDECFDAVGLFTRQQLNTFSLEMCSFTQDLFDRQQAETISSDEIATAIETTVNNPSEKFQKLVYPYSEDYTDLYGR